MLKGLFRRQSFLEEGFEEWCLDAFAWLMRNLGGASHLAAAPLVLANTDFFPPTTTGGQARAVYLSERTWAFAIALFLMLKGAPLDPARKT